MLKGIVRGALTFVGLMAKPDLIAQTGTEQPEEMTRGRLYLVVGRSGPKWAIFLCPCGCGQKVLLSLNKDRRPRWAVTQDWLGRPSVFPSVNQLDGCRSHFWIKNGGISWCPDSTHNRQQDSYR